MSSLLLREINKIQYEYNPEPKRGSVTISCCMWKRDENDWITKSTYRRMRDKKQCGKLPRCNGRMRLYLLPAAELQQVRVHDCTGDFPSMASVAMATGIDVVGDATVIDNGDDGGGKLVVGDADTATVIDNAGDDKMLTRLMRKRRAATRVSEAVDVGNDTATWSTGNISKIKKISAVVGGESLSIIVDKEFVQKDKPKSFQIKDFLAHNPGLRKEIVDFFDALFMNGFQEPWSIGPKLIVSLDAPYWTHHQASVDREGYIRLNFSIDDDTLKTNNPKTVFRFSYGTGSGLTTHGIAKK